jgi:hypothetical protein
MSHDPRDSGLRSNREFVGHWQRIGSILEAACVQELRKFRHEDHWAKSTLRCKLRLNMPSRRQRADWLSCNGCYRERAKRR